MNQQNDSFSLLWRPLYPWCVVALMLMAALFGCRRNPEAGETNLEEMKRAVAAGAAEVEFRVGPSRFILVRIPSGEFEMGSPSNEEGHQLNESPVRRIRISKPFYLGRYEVTQLQYKEVMGESPGDIQGDSLPVVGITYREALQFCQALSMRSGLPITLPTEAQWEYACRAGTKSRYYSGDNTTDLDKVGWYRDNSGETIHPVGQKQPNAWGLYDMHGNAWEACADFLPDYESVQGEDPQGPFNPLYGAMRGGGRMHPAEYCRVATRLMSHDMFGGMGIRIALHVQE